MDYLVNGFHNAFSLLAHMDEATLSAIHATLASTCYAMTVALLLGLPFGFVLGYCAFPGRRALRLISDTLLAFPTVLIGLLVYAFITARGPLGEYGLLFTLPGMKLTVKLSTTLRDCVPGYEPEAGLQVDMPEGGTVAQLAQHLGLPLQDIKIVMAEQGETCPHAARLFAAARAAKGPSGKAPP